MTFVQTENATESNFEKPAFCFIIQVESTRGYGHSEFREDLKQLYTIAGVEGSPVMFLLSDKQNLTDAQIEDVSNMLSNGEVRGLFQVRSSISLAKPTVKFPSTF